MERTGSVIPYVSFPAATASCTAGQVTSPGFQPSRASASGRTPSATGEDITGVSLESFPAASGRSRR